MASLSFLNILTVLVFLYIVISEIVCVRAQNPAIAQQLTIQVLPGVEECFYERMEPNRTLTVDYAVTATSQGGHDINFQLLQPDGRPLVSEFRKASSTASISTMYNPGIYTFCFDNTFSHLSRKTVTFNFVSAESNPNAVNWEAYNQESLSPEGVYSMTVEQIMKTVDKVRLRMDDIQVMQDNYRILESRDRTTAETSYERINFWSMMCILAIIVFGSLQVFVLRSLFEDKYKGVYSFLDKKLQR